MKHTLQVFFLQIFFSYLLYATEIGINYHAHTADFKNSVFLPQYHKESTRDTVISQLKIMKEEGVDSIFTHIFIGAPQSAGKTMHKKNKYLITFPPNVQDLNNLQNYISDVKELNMTLDLGFLWLGQADFDVGCIDPDDDGKDRGCDYENIGHGKINPTKFLEYATDTVNSVFNIKNISYVRNFYFDGEVLYHPDPENIPIGQYRRKRKNENWFFENIYPIFATSALANDINPMLYFLPTKPNPSKYTYGILSNSWNSLPTKYASVKGHRSMYAPLRSLLYIRETFTKNHWPQSWMPKEYATSFYLDGDNIADKILWIKKYIDDIHFVLEKNNFHFTDIIVAETGNLQNCKEQDILNQELKKNKLKSIIYWTTPFGETRKKLGNDETSYLLDSHCNHTDLFSK